MVWGRKKYLNLGDKNGKENCSFSVNIFYMGKYFGIINTMKKFKLVYHN